MFYSRELLGRKSPLSEIWCAKHFANLPVGCLWALQPVVEGASMLISAPELPAASPMPRLVNWSGPQFKLDDSGSSGFVSCRLAAHGKKLVRRTILGVDILQTW